jgi:signal transduction histidine kinase
VEISLSPLKTDEGTLISAAIRDVTERRNAERALSAAHAQIRAYAANLERKVIERTAELHESIESLELLTYTMAHDLRTPIRAMQGFAAALREDVPMDETGRMYAVRIAEAADRMSQLVNDLLDYARLARLTIPLEPVELKPTLEKVVALWDDKIKRSHAEITVEEPLPAVSGNEVFLSHVMNNLLGNALKFVAPGAAPRIFIHAEAHNSVVRLWFEDNGIGIAPEYHERIFGIFQRLHATEEYPGTGLGLAFVKRAVERMSGRLGLESEPGKGSRFWIEFPRAAG